MDSSDALKPLAEGPVQPLRGVRVLEFAHWMAGPLAGGLLSDWGAEVLKVEPRGGEAMRHLFAHIGADASTPNAAFTLANRGKRSLELDIKSPEGRDAFERLLSQCDVLLTNLRPDALQRLGLGAKEVRERHPRLVYCTVSAYGWGGPDQDRPGYDIAAYYGRTGISHEITTNGEAPVALMQGMGDAFTAMAATSGILAALMERQQTGRGRFVEASLLRTGMWALGGELGQQAMGGRPKPPRAREQSRTPLYNTYRSSDGRWFFLVGVEARRHLPPVLHAIGRPDLIDDERFKSSRAIATHSVELIRVFDAAFGSQPMDHWARELDRHGAWWAPVQTPEQVLDDAQAQAVGAWVEVDGHRTVDAPLRFDFAHRGSAPRAPRSGEHTASVLADFGFTPQEIARLVPTGEPKKE